MSKVYLVMEYRWNGEFWEDFEEKDIPVRAFGSKEEAKNFIKTMTVPLKKLLYDEEKGFFECEELEKNKLGGWKRPSDEENYEVLWKVEGAIRAFTLRNKYGCDQCYAYYISEVPFGEENKDE